MGSDVHFLKEADLPAFLQALSGDSFFATVQRQEQVSYEELPLEERGRAALRCAPPVESVKGFLFPVRERVAVYGGDAGGGTALGLGAPSGLGAKKGLGRGPLGQAGG